MNKPYELTWRPMTAADMPDVMAVQALAHPVLQERAAILHEKLERCPAGCSILADACGAVRGYCLGHPWVLDRVPGLDGPLSPLRVSPDCLFVHDIALTPEARGQGHARQVLGGLRRLAVDSGLGWLALVAVHGSVAVWERCGFQKRIVPELVPVLNTYGSAAAYMTSRAVQPAQSSRAVRRDDNGSSSSSQSGEADQPSAHSS